VILLIIPEFLKTQFKMKDGKGRDIDISATWYAYLSFLASEILRLS